MNALYNFIMAEYSLIISIAGTVVGLVISLVGAAYSEDKIKKIGWSCIAFFVVLCVVILTLKIAFGNDKGVTDTNGNPYQPTLGPGSAETSESTPEPKPESTSEPTPELTPEPKPAATPEPTPEPKPVATPEPTPEPKPAATPELTPEPTPELTLEPKPAATPEPTSEPTPEATPEPTLVPTPEPRVEPALEIAPIEASYYSIAPVASSDSSISPVEIITFSGSISSLEQVDDYSFVPEIDGTYRFEFSDVPSGTYYNLYIFNAGNERLKYATSLGNGGGITISLSAGESYNLRVEQRQNMGTYTLNVGPQKPMVDVSQLTAVNDSIQYTEQENNYSFIAPRDGVYRFEFSNVQEGTDFSLYVYNSGWERLKYAQNLDNGDGISTGLSEGQKYYIRVKQYNSIGTYTLNIGQKKEIADITAYTAVSDSIQYTDQENDYAFVPSVSGTYRFELSDVPDGTDLSLYAYNSGWERITYDQNLDSGDGISVEVSSGKTYYIRVRQYNKYGTYKLHIIKER